MVKKLILGLILPLLVIISIWSYIKDSRTSKNTLILKSSSNPILKQSLDPLQIDSLRHRDYPGSNLKIEQTLSDGINYHQFIASYLSDNLKINGLLTVPKTSKPPSGYPVIIFNHGYIPPDIYKTTERYVSYVDYFARNGYIVFKSDYRGNGSSEGQPEGAYYSPAYTIDVLNALSSVKKFKDVDPQKIGMWGHSMGGNITLRSLVLSKDIKVAVIWGGVVGSYDDLMNNWQRSVPFKPSPSELTLRNRRRSDLVKQFGTPQENPNFWNSLDPNSYLNDIFAPLQLDVGTSDEEVPWIWSENLYNKLKDLNKTVEFYTYAGADHNISDPSFSLAINRSLAFFDKYLK